MRKTAVIDVSTSGSALLQGCCLQEHQSPSTNDDKDIHSVEHWEQIHPIEMRSSVGFREHTAPNTPAPSYTTPEVCSMHIYFIIHKLGIKIL
jgi:hypothetical protein